ncbi:hypothetical protein SEA_EASTWEST_45 [Arthrobacter phage EastWest]|uniref:Uncharacterized protein n=1 Tax=Arthrobacter phage EastWest TaxID=2894292 RepID=A0AAE8YK72_9CAUD|nr:hypothetical protein SEA_EASTWEST_45 [Arthrobacter phage EastWest]
MTTPANAPSPIDKLRKERDKRRVTVSTDLTMQPEETLLQFKERLISRGKQLNVSEPCSINDHIGCKWTETCECKCHAVINPADTLRSMIVAELRDAMTLAPSADQLDAAANRIAELVRSFDRTQTRAAK